MAELKTRKTGASVAAFLNGIADDEVRRDCKTVAEIMQKATGSKGQMYGSAIVGFGTRRVRYADGREIEWMMTGFSPRKQNIVLYVLGNVEGQNELLKTLGSHSRGKGCLYIKRLSDVHMPTLKKIVTGTVKHLRR